MTTNTITHTVTFCASPKEVYDALMDPKKHSEITGYGAEIERKPGGRFIQYGGGHWGTLIEFRENEKIVQFWHAKNWPEGHFSEAIFTLTPLANGRRTELTLVQTGVPEDHFAETDKGWRKLYWTKMADYFREEKAAVVKRFVEEVRTKGNFDLADELFAPDFVLHRAGVIEPIGPEGPKEDGKALLEAFSELQIRAEDTIVEGDRVVQRQMITAIHTGAFSCIEATGRKVCWTENNIYRIEDSKIAEAWAESSLNDLVAQLTSKEVRAA